MVEGLAGNLLLRTMQTEGLGGPCPRCGSMNCFIKKGSGTWYDFLACSDCLFAYGEHAGNMQEQTDGIVSGTDVWIDLIHAHRDKISSLEDLKDFCDATENEYPVESPFDMGEVSAWTMNLCVVSEAVMEEVIDAVQIDKEAMKRSFIQAVENDEYAEFQLKPDLHIITDFEGDGSFNPYIQTQGDYSKSDVVDLLYNKATFINYRDLVEDGEGNFDIEIASISKKHKL